jgi:hypothetical protein
LFLLGLPAWTHAAAQTGSADANSELRRMSTQAGVIFAGQVLGVVRQDAAGYVEVRFHVDQAVLGCETGAIYVVREWAGLWRANPARYRAGERRLMLLLPRSAAGLSSPVGGLDGAIPILAQEPAPIASQAGVAPVDTGRPAALSLDLSRVQARVLRAPTRAAGAQNRPEESAWAGPITPMLAAGASTSPLIVPLDGPLNLLRSARPAATPAQPGAAGAH